MLPIPVVFVLGVNPRGGEPSVSGRLLRFERVCADLLPPGDIDAAKTTQTEARIIDTSAFCRWPEDMLL